MSNTRRLRPPPTEVLYARLPPELVDYVREQAARSGLSMAKAAEVMLGYCRSAGLTLEAAQPASGPLARDTPA